MAQIILSVGAAPSTPPTGAASVYVKADKLLYFKDDAGVEHKVLDNTGAAFTGPVTSTAGDVDLKTNTALADATATLTAVQLRGGEFTITPTAARTLTLDTAANIIANLTGSVDNSNYEITIVNLAAFDVTLATGVGVTIVGRAVINNGSATFRVRRLTSTTVEFKRLGGTAAISQVMYVQDQKAVGTFGGDSVVGIQTRVINTVVSNTIVGASLATNQVTLPSGTYYIEASAPTYLSGRHKLYLYNITDAALAISGTAEYNSTSGTVQTRSFIRSPLIITAAKVFEIRHQIASALVSNGLGLETNVSAPGLEVYTEMKITKVS
jgi:hypothetical protein